ncbi:MAG: SIMPL domain-containing protein [Pseudomonadales bacterium]|nr:SIMPL domain-containing protein [Pseudomonadales bacterium]
MKRLTTAALMLFALFTLSACGQPQPPGQRDSVTVSGVGEVSARPDIFRIVATARERGDDIDDMKAAVDKSVADMLDLADDLDIEEDQVRASDLRVQPQWQYQPERKLIGHEVSREVIFRVKGLEAYTGLLQGLAEQGVRDIRPAGTEVSNADALSDQALEKAVANARRRATIIAEAADRDLGQAIEIQAHNIQTPRPMAMMARSKEGAMADSYRPGETDISAQVQVTFELD